MKGLFEIYNFNEAGENDVLDMKISEEPATKVKEVEIPVPCGDKEQPTKAAIEIDEDTYNSAIDKLQQSFKEAADTMELLRSAKIVESAHVDQDIVADAIYEYAMGPMFEKVTNDDKDEVKKIVSDIKADVKNICDDNNANFRDAKRVLKLVASIGLFFPATVAVSVNAATQGLMMLFNTRAYQTLGMVTISEPDCKALVEYINKKLAEKLGEYKVVAWNIKYQTIVDAFVRGGSSRDRMNPYILLVDKKIPAEFDKAGKKLDDAVKAAEKNEEEK